jgi:hypothetical protein
VSGRVAARALRRTGRRLRTVLVAAALATAACDDPTFNSPGLGDFVQDVDPNDGEVLTSDKLGTTAIAVFLNFIPAETGVGFGTLGSFRVNDEDVTPDVQVFLSNGTPALSATLSFRPADVEQGEHEVEVVYSDSRGVVHRIRWGFRVEG